jgi:hypothetical protein
MPGSIDQAQLTAVVRRTLPDGVVTFRSSVLSALTSGPWQHGAFTLFLCVPRISSTALTSGVARSVL